MNRIRLAILPLALLTALLILLSESPDSGPRPITVGPADASESRESTSIEGPPLARDSGARSPVRLEAAGNPTTIADPGPLDHSTTLVVVRVVPHGSDLSLTHGTVVVTPCGEAPFTGSLGPDGVVEFELAPGSYSFGVDPASLVGPYVASMRQGECHRSIWERQPHEFPPVLEVGAGDRVLEVSVPVFPACTVAGQVTGADGLPVAGRRVRLHSILTSRMGTTLETRTSTEGRFSFTVPPGAYRVRVWDIPEDRLDGAHLPSPQDVWLDPGHQVEVSLEARIGTATIRGQVIDPPLLEGEEFLRYDGMMVLLRPADVQHQWPEEVHGYKLNDNIASDLTDADGHFEFTGLRAGRYVLRFGPYEYKPFSAEGRMGVDLPPQVVQVERGDSIDLGSVYLPRSRTCDLIVSAPQGLRRRLEVRVTSPTQALEEREPRSSMYALSPGSAIRHTVHTSPDSTPAVVEWRYAGDPSWRDAQPVALVAKGEVHLAIEVSD